MDNGQDKRPQPIMGHGGGDGGVSGSEHILGAIYLLTLPTHGIGLKRRVDDWLAWSNTLGRDIPH